MALKIVWTEKANNQVIETFQFWNENNQSNNYSRRLEKEILKQEKIIANFPNTGILTDNPDYRVVIVEHFKLFYRIDGETIYIVSFFDSRQHPAKAMKDLNQKV